MVNFTLYDETTAPTSTQPTLAKIRETYGMIPNLYGYLAESPIALNAYIHINEQLMKHSSLTPVQVQVALLAISTVNNCEFCIAAHSWVGSTLNAREQTVKAIREGGQIENNQDKALVQLVQAIVKDRGYVADEIIQQFYDAGFSKENLMDLLVCNMLKSLSNYANHITKTEINAEFAAFSR
ncbi:hypothetical protein NBRC116188_17210 [Oceaniserpentilla sp. 4NH20-0058]|uniref:carboxymuconolactone decarboxylase family protein n=1 Tax=Oceaniserpentilla sp. 4NH20-0058 TaxID=3127660 RepID=UPI00310789EC